MEQMDRDLNLVIVGHVDHGKSRALALRLRGFYLASSLFFF